MIIHTDKLFTSTTSKHLMHRNRKMGRVFKFLSRSRLSGGESRIYIFLQGSRLVNNKLRHIIITILFRRSTSN